MGYFEFPVCQEGIITKGQARKAERLSAIPIYGIADLHLPECGGWGLNGSTPAQPWRTLRENWQDIVPENALVLLPGDLCHHDTPEAAYRGYGTIAALPGALKILTSGNHDWATGSSLRDLRAATDHPGLVPLLGSAYRVEAAGQGLVVAGTCGAWPTMNGGGQHRPCYHKELRRLQNALKQAAELRRPGDGLIVMVHYPPRPDGRPTRMSRLIENSRANLCVYGHVHDPSRWSRMGARRHGPTMYRLLAADYLGLEPRRLGELGRRGLRLD